MSITKPALFSLTTKGKKDKQITLTYLDIKLIAYILDKLEKYPNLYLYITLSTAKAASSKAKSK